MTSVTDPQSTQSTLAAEGAPFKFPRYHSSYPPFFTLQPTLLTRTAQLRKWSLLIQSYCRHNRIYRLSLIDAVNSPLFHNAQIGKRLSLMDARTVLDWMTSEEGEKRAEWIGRKEDKVAAWVWWRRPEEWAEVFAAWVEETGQKGTVLTLYEIVNGLPSEDQEFHAMDREVLQRSLGILVKRGKAQVFGSEDEQGVKFF
ncbi:MAG: hypothetical protein Q9191_003823 [Dirinaria sp. TL-2023a]